MKIRAFSLAVSLLSSGVASSQSDYVFSLATKLAPPSAAPAEQVVRHGGGNNPKSGIAAQRPEASVLGTPRQALQPVGQVASTGGVQQPADGEVATNPERLFLICVGAGRSNQLRFGDFGGSSASWSESVPFDEQVNIEITPSEARVRMPRAMLPLIRGGTNGWMKIHDVRWSDIEIIGSIAVNPINNPKLRIDRLTGAMSINGKAGGFSARCVAVDPDRIKRKF